MNANGRYRRIGRAEAAARVAARAAKRAGDRRPGRYVRPLAIALVGILTLWQSGAARAQVTRLVLGNQDRSWAENGDLNAVDVESVPGWIQPIQATPDVNILHELYRNDQLYPRRDQAAAGTFQPGKDGRIWSRNMPPATNLVLLQLGDGLQDTSAMDYFNRYKSNTGVKITVDLGLPYPLTEIGFNTLEFGRHVDLFVKGFELLGNDGSPENLNSAGNPSSFFVLADVPTNTEREVSITDFPSQHIRFLQLHVTTPQAFEIDQLDIRGEGFVQRGVYTSRVYDMEDIANFGRVFWEAEADSGARVSIRTRFGNDRTTLIHNMINELGDEVALTEATDAENRDAHDSLPTAARSSIQDDTENWTLWSVPYERSGQELSLIRPSRFFQFRVVMESDLTTSASRVDSIAFEFSRPTMARRVAAEISPRQGVALGQEQVFTYQIRPEISAADIGYDTVELEMPFWSQLHSVQLAGRLLSEDDYDSDIEKNLLRLRLLDPDNHITADADVLQLEFSTRMLIYGTFFGGLVSPSGEEDLLPQLIEEDRDGDLTVLGTEGSLGKVLLGGVARPPVFTPNGDGINDRSSLEFDVAQVMGEAPLRVVIYDLSGRAIRTVADRQVESDSFSVEWDGRDAAGDFVPPGLYLYRVLVDGDSRDYTRTGTVGVAY